MSGIQSSYPEFKSGYPFNVYLIIAIPIILLVTALFHQLNLNGVMTNLPIGVLIFYILFSRLSSKIKIADNELQVHYFFPWNDSVSACSHKDKNKMSVQENKVNMVDQEVLKSANDTIASWLANHVEGGNS